MTVEDVTHVRRFTCDACGDVQDVAGSFPPDDWQVVEPAQVALLPTRPGPPREVEQYRQWHLCGAHPPVTMRAMLDAWAKVQPTDWAAVPYVERARAFGGNWSEGTETGG